MHLAAMLMLTNAVEDAMEESLESLKQLYKDTRAEVRALSKFRAQGWIGRVGLAVSKHGMSSTR